MEQAIYTWVTTGRRTFRQLFTGPQAVVFVPAMVLAGLWFGGDAVLWPVMIGVPFLVFLANSDVRRVGARGTRAPDRLGHNVLRRVAQSALRTSRETGASAVCMVFELSGTLPDGPARKAVRAALLQRLRDGLRENDTAGWTEDGTLVVILQPGQMLDLDAALQAARRLQTRLEDPIANQSRLWHVSACVGLATSTRLRPGATGADLLTAANGALAQARAAGASAVRTFAPARRPAGTPQSPPIIGPDDAVDALRSGEIQPWFQPQLCTESGRISGVEALARWQHPIRGLVAPFEFLPALRCAGAMTDLGDTILESTCKALQTWDATGPRIPDVAVNFSEEELADPKLPDRVRQILQTHGIDPHRLRIEVTEGVVLGNADSDTANCVARLAALGCRIDLDDFGTGATALTALQRVHVDRLKIDRTFVTRVDRDEHQRKLLAAIVSLAERLGLETLAEGVESHGEHALAAQLGCTHVQGFGIARPMPEDLIPGWARDQSARLARLPRLSLNRGADLG